MIRDPNRQNHPWSVYLIGLFVLLMTLFVLGGVVNHLAFSSHGPGLLIPLVEKFQEDESDILKTFERHSETQEHRRFHHLSESREPPEHLRPTCFICHSNLPHAKTKKIRAMLNMHTNFSACETCHLETEEDEELVYKWYSPVEEDPEGPFFGTSYDPETGEMETGKNRFAKIAPFYKKNGELESTLHTKQTLLARDYVRVRDELSPQQREGMTKRFHVDIREKGPECHTCHDEEGILDFEKLGFSEKRISDLESLSIKGLITKYDEFYLPDLFDQSIIPGSEGLDSQ